MSPVFERDLQFSRRVENARMSDDTQELVDACQGIAQVPIPPPSAAATRRLPMPGQFLALACTRILVSMASLRPSIKSKRPVTVVQANAGSNRPFSVRHCNT